MTNFIAHVAIECSFKFDLLTSACPWKTRGEFFCSTKNYMPSL